MNLALLMVFLGGFFQSTVNLQAPKQDTVFLLKSYEAVFSVRYLSILIRLLRIT